MACLNTSRLAYLSANSVGSYYLLSYAIKDALSIGLLNKRDLMTTDADVMSILKSANVDSSISKYISRLNRDTKFEFCDKSEAEYSTNNKVRYVDPIIREAKTSIKVSECLSNFIELIHHTESTLSHVHIKQIT